MITGSLSLPREDFKKIIEDLNGKVSGSVSVKTDYLLLGEKEENLTSPQPSPKERDETQFQKRKICQRIKYKNLIWKRFLRDDYIKSL